MSVSEEAAGADAASKDKTSAEDVELLDRLSRFTDDEWRMVELVLLRYSTTVPRSRLSRDLLSTLRDILQSDKSGSTYAAATLIALVQGEAPGLPEITDDRVLEKLSSLQLLFGGAATHFWEQELEPEEWRWIDDDLITIGPDWNGDVERRIRLRIHRGDGQQLRLMTQPFGLGRLIRILARIASELPSEWMAEMDFEALTGARQYLESIPAVQQGMDQASHPD